MHVLKGNVIKEGGVGPLLVANKEGDNLPSYRKYFNM